MYIFFSQRIQHIICASLSISILFISVYFSGLDDKTLSLLQVSFFLSTAVEIFMIMCTCTRAYEYTVYIHMYAYPCMCVSVCECVCIYIYIYSLSFCMSFENEINK